MADYQQQKTTPPAYVVTPDDHGYVLLALGAVVFPFGLRPGFYVTIVNSSGANVTITAVNATVRSASGNTTLTSASQTTTVLRLINSNDFLAFGVP